MSKAKGIGPINPDLLYTASDLAEHEGVSVNAMKRFIRERCIHSEPWEGRLSVKGVYYIQAHQDLAEIDTPEARAKRQQAKGGRAKPKTKEETN